jgi:AcrR family transcriptional regulator
MARRPGRPRAHGRVSTLEPKEEILVAAARLFSGQGVGATRITDVAEAVGVSPPSSSYFAGPGSPARRLHSLVARHVDRLIAGPFDLWFVVGMRDPDRKRHKSVAREPRAWRDALARVVIDGVDVGQDIADLAVRALGADPARAVGEPC